MRTARIIFGWKDNGVGGLFAVVIYGILGFIKKLLNGNDDLPKRVTLGLYPSVLKQVRLPGCVITMANDGNGASAIRVVTRVLYRDNGGIT